MNDFKFRNFEGHNSRKDTSINLLWNLAKQYNFKISNNNNIVTVHLWDNLSVNKNAQITSNHIMISKDGNIMIN